LTQDDRSRGERPNEGFGTTELILLIGLQAAGKTTFYRQRLADGYRHISMDLLRNTSHLARRC
jgi:signal recognition particle GTPase